jgi:hypothetical protein
MPTKKVSGFFLSVGTFKSVFKDNKSLRSHKIVVNKVFLLLFAVSWRPKNLRILRIRKTGSDTVLSGIRTHASIKVPVRLNEIMDFNL